MSCAYSRGDALNGFADHAHGLFRRLERDRPDPEAEPSTSGAVGRFGTIDASDGGDALPLQRLARVAAHRRGSASTKVSAFGIAYNLNLFSNFTFFLDNPQDGDQFRQSDRRLVTGASVSHRRLSRWFDRPQQVIAGVQVRHDDIANIGLYRTKRRATLSTVREDAVLQTNLAGYAQHELGWKSWLRTFAGLRVDGYRFDVSGGGDDTSPSAVFAGLVSPKAAWCLARGTAMSCMSTPVWVFTATTRAPRPASVETARRPNRTRDAAGRAPRGRRLASGASRIPHLQTSVALWMLTSDSELVFIGDAGTTEPGRPSRRHGIEWSNYYSPLSWLIFDADVSVSQARFRDASPAGTPHSRRSHDGRFRRPFSRLDTQPLWQRTLAVLRPAAVDRGQHSPFERHEPRQPRGGLQVQSIDARRRRHRQSLRYEVERHRLFLRLASSWGEPAGGIADVHLHRTLPRTVRLNLILGF